MIQEIWSAIDTFWFGFVGGYIACIIVRNKVKQAIIDEIKRRKK